jgi:hypothetical protein
MICHICEGAATLQCPLCRRGACKTHTEFDPGHYEYMISRYQGIDNFYSFAKGNSYVCSACADGRRRETAQVEKAVADELSRQNWCDACRTVGEAMTPSCAVCKKRFCARHGQVVRYPTKANKGRAGWCRCQEHLKLPGLLGVQWLAPTFFNTYSKFGEPDGELPADPFKENKKSRKIWS